MGYNNENGHGATFRIALPLYTIGADPKDHKRGRNDQNEMALTDAKQL